jgi:hypothetical protein
MSSRPFRPRRRAFAAAVLATVFVLMHASNVLACGGLVAPNGTINLVRTTTLAAYHGGVEHYLTSFSFAGQDADEVGSIVPLPGVPTRVVKGGDWTLQRLLIETQPPLPEGAVAAQALSDSSAEVLLETTIDALDITVLRGGAVAVGRWADDHGFFLPPDAPEVLAFYAERSPIFLAARFDAGRAAAQGVQQGDGTPIHVAIPTPNPWVPLRILALGRRPVEIVDADVFLLTDSRPATLPLAVEPSGDPSQLGLIQQASEPASTELMADLRSDDRMGWLPETPMWLTHIRVHERAAALGHDLAIDASGFGQPDPVAAGYRLPSVVPVDGDGRGWVVVFIAIALALATVALLSGRAGNRAPAS